MKRLYIPGLNKGSLMLYKQMFWDIYSPREEQSKGRLISLGSGLMAAIYNVFITGIFYTGFLSMYDISITGVGIISFIPALTNVFSIFSSMVLERFQKRKGILLAAKIYFYAMYILATTLMPQFVKDPDARLTWFVVLVFLAHAVYAVFSPGFTTWFYKFYPEDNARRTRYIMLNQIFSSAICSIILLLSGLLTDAVAGSPYQNTLILAMRYLAFGLVLIDVGMQACAKEYPYGKVEQPRLTDIFRLPFRYRKFMFCMLMQFAWSYISNLNGGMWNYHLLNHMHFSYTLINSMIVAYTVILICTASLWRKLLQRYSWIKTFGIATMMWWPTEIFFFFMVPGREWLYVPLSLIQSVINVGLNLSYANILYMNLPEENTNTHIVFNTVGCNFFAFLGLLTGTWLSSLTGDTTVHMFGMDMYSVQWTTIARAVTILAMAVVCLTKWRAFTRDADIEEIELQQQQRKQMRAVRKLRQNNKQSS